MQVRHLKNLGLELESPSKPISTFLYDDKENFIEVFVKDLIEKNFEHLIPADGLAIKTK